MVAVRQSFRRDKTVSATRSLPRPRSNPQGRRAKPPDLLTIGSKAARSRAFDSLKGSNILRAPDGIRRTSEASVHDVEADAASRGVLESFGNGSDDAKPERLPEPHGDVVRFRNGVKLHRGVSLLTGPGECVLAESASAPVPARRRRP
jgi:hypothetical protein